MRLARGLLALLAAVGLTATASASGQSLGIGFAIPQMGPRGISVAPPAPAPTATATATQLAYADQIFQRDTLTGGGLGKGQAAIPVTFSSVGATGTVNACLSSASGTHLCDLQPEFQAATIGSTSASPVTVNLSGVDAGLRWGYLSVHDALGWVDGTTRIGIGDLSLIAGQSLGVNFVAPRDTATLASLSITPSTYTRVFTAYQGGATVCSDYFGSPASMVWTVPSDSSATPCYRSAGVVTYLNDLAAYYGVNQGMIGAVADGAAAQGFNVGGTQYSELSSVAAAAGGKWRFDNWFQGHQEAKSNAYAPQVQRDQHLRIAVFDALNGCSSSCGGIMHLLSGIPNINSTGYGPMRGLNEVRLGQKMEAAAHPSTVVYADSEGVSEADGIHEMQLGAQTIGHDWSAAVTGQAPGPKILSATRSGQTITVTMDQPYVATGTWWKRFVAYLSGSTLTIYPIDGGTPLTSTTLSLHIADGNDPGDGQLIGLWLGAPLDGDAGTNDPSGMMLKSASGRTFTPSTAEYTVAAPSPGGAKNAPAVGYATSQSLMDLTPGASSVPSYGAGTATGFGRALTAGVVYSTQALQTSPMPVSIEAIITVPNSSGGNAVIAGYRTSGATLLLNTTLHVTFSGPGFGVTGATALTAGDTWYIAGVADDNGTRLIIAKWNGSGWNTATKDASNTTSLAAKWSLTAQRFFIGDNTTTASGTATTSFFKGGGAGAIAHVAVWNKSIYLSTDATFTPPSTGRAGTEPNLLALFKFPSGTETQDSVRAQ